MECFYHPEREGTDQCAICGKSICKECGLEIAGKVYCKECLEKIVGLGASENAQQEPEPVVVEEPIITEEPTISEVIDDSIYQPQENAEEYEIPYAPQEEASFSQGISEDSPYNIRSNVETGSLDNPENIYQAPQAEPTPQVAQNEYDYPNEPTLKQQSNADDFIYPDHSYDPQPTSARQELEDKYERYLDDLYFDENETPLNEQLAKDEAQYGSLTRREYAPRPTEAVEQQPPTQKKIPKQETPEEMEARIRAEILKEQGLVDNKNENIHNLNYKDDKEPMGVVDILLTIILVIVILIVIYYLIYLFLLNASYPTFMDAVFALKNPQNVINNLLLTK